MPYEYQIVDDNADTVAGGDVAQTDNTTLASLNSNIDAQLGTSDSSANSVVGEYDPSPEGGGLNTDEEVAPSGGQPLTPPEHGIEHNGHASGVPML